MVVVGKHYTNEFDHLSNCAMIASVNAYLSCSFSHFPDNMGAIRDIKSDQKRDGGGGEDNLLIIISKIKTFLAIYGDLIE